MGTRTPICSSILFSSIYGNIPEVAIGQMPFPDKQHHRVTFDVSNCYLSPVVEKNMLINMSPCGSTLEEQLSSIMDVLAKAAVSEISQLISDGSATLQLQITQSREENEALRTRMKVMKSELFSLRLQTRSNASRAQSRFGLARPNICKPRTTSMRNDLKPLMDHKAVGISRFQSTSKSEASSVTSPAEETPDIILIKVEEDISGCRPLDDCNAFGDRNTQSTAALKSLHVDAPGSSHMSSHNGELRILSVHGHGGGQLVVDGHDTLFSASDLEALSSLSVDHSVAKSLDCGKRLVHCEELTGHRGGRKGRPCVLCGKVFPNDSKMTIHMRTHTSEKPYRCDQCMKRFSQSCSLKIHMRIHSGEKPCVCHQCNISYRYSSSLRRHMTKHKGKGVL
ncbi:zinc finger protein 160 isoform X2 [Gadus morhua]|uniref:zinc finger protein 160 isoform X2 n=1 Tax=Gadus morhua TaxID=8049 RepID=UPI0011B3BF44|nr:zinc finger protein 160-like isoform X2 [Gadus morhua]